MTRQCISTNCLIKSRSRVKIFRLSKETVGKTFVPTSVRVIKAAHVIVVMVLDALELTADTNTFQVKIKSLQAAISEEIRRIRLQLISSVIISHASSVQVQFSGSSVLHVSSSASNRVLCLWRMGALEASRRLNVHVS
jgi:hypothetical protein